MNPKDVVLHLARGREALSGLVTGLSSRDARWKPSSEKWSILEVVNHLADEEKDDFRMRLDFTLHKPGEPWPAIDPEGWCRDRRYNDRDLPESLNRFLAEREASMTWLASLSPVNWDLAYEHPRAGPLRAGDLAASWITHDLLHVRQIARLHHERLEADFGPYSSGYAGRWS